MLGLNKTVLFAASLIFNLFMAQAQQDTLLVKGIILSGTNNPVPDVSVSIEGSSQLPVVSDQEGAFMLKASSGEVWLIVSPTGGFKSKRVYLNNRRNLTIFLTPDDMASGNDLVTVLSQNFRKRSLLGAFYDINVKPIDESNALTLDQFMQGRVPGAYIVNKSGMPGAGSVTSIRGINSIYAGNSPLYIIDGVPLTGQGIFGSNLDGFAYNPLTAVNTYDISKMTVLKDPANTAAYGSKGSNGVITIETLDPSVTQTTIELDLKTGYSLTPTNLIPQLNGEQHKTLINEILFSAGLYEEDILEYFPNLFLTKDDVRYIDYQHNTNWQDLIFQNASYNSINLNVKGGDEIARYGLSFGYMKSDGIIKETGMDGYNLRFVSRLNIFTWLKMNAGVSLNYNTSRLKEAATVDETSPILASLAKSPLLNPYQYDEEGNELTILSEVDELGVSNPLAIANNYEAKNTNYNFTATLGLEGSIKKNLVFNSNFSLTYDVLKEQIFMPNHGMQLYYDYEAINVAKATNNDLNSFYNNTYLKYTKSFGPNHQFSSNTGLHLYTNEFQLDWALTKNAHENDQYRTLGDGQDNLREIGGDNRTWNWLSFYEYLNYSYKAKYLLTATVSLDGSSRVGDNAVNTMKIGNQPFGLFYSGGIGWRISNEDFLKNISWLEDMKFRVTMGKTGNDDIGESSATNYYQAVKFRETVGLYPAVIPNDKLSYEILKQVDGGLDLSLWGNRFSVKADIFRSTTDNMLIYTPLDAFLGYDLRIENGGKMENTGMEFSTFLRIVSRNNFSWDIQANYSAIKNQVLEIKGNKLITSVPGAEIVNMVGAPVNSYYGFVYEGVYTTQAMADEAAMLNAKGIPYRAGDAIYADLSGPDNAPDGIINDYDKTTIGSSLPKFYGGFVNTLTYKKWSLSIVLQGVSGNKLYNYVRYRNESMTGLENQSASVLNRWQFDGQQTDVPRALANDPIGNSAFSSRWIEDGSYIRLKNVTLSYTVPDEFLTFKSAMFYVTASNLFILTNYLGYDPEFAYSYSNIHQGIDYGLMPQARQFIAGIKVGL